MRMKIASIIVLLTCASISRGNDYYLWCYAYEASPRAADSHTFATVEEVSPNGARIATISWMPASLNVRVFGSPERGVNLTLSQTLALAQARHAKVTAYGPYRVTPSFYYKFLLRVAQLNSGSISYVVNDRSTYPLATNCIHAVSGINGRLYTGLSWGRSATEQVIRHFGLVP